MSQLFVEIRIYPRAPLTEGEQEEVKRKVATLGDGETVEELSPYVIQAAIDRKRIDDAVSPREMVSCMVADLMGSVQEVLETILPAPW